MEPSWTDQVSAFATAIGALAAIYAGYYAYKAFRKENEDVQEQINGLKLLAIHQSKQNEILEKQLNMQVEEKMDKNMPNLKVYEKNFTKEGWEIIFINKGGRAIDIRLSKDGREYSDISSCIFRENFADTNETIEFKCYFYDKNYPPMKNEGTEPRMFIFDIRMTSKDKNVFSQTILIKGEFVIVTLPYSIKKDSSNSSTQD